MWFRSTKMDSLKAKKNLFLSLYEECKSSQPQARLSNQMKQKLEKLPRDLRREIASMTKDGCTPLFMACKNGHVEIVEYLITVCDVDIEQRGTYEVHVTSNNQCVVTPLWCAAVSGKLPVTKCLVEHGADINAVSDTGSTPVRSACFLTHLDIVIYLVEHGADIQRGNYNGGTCLINSVQSVELCAYLLQHGADVNAKDIQDKTALHYAIQEHRLEASKLLLDHGADPYARSRWNDDALRLACLKGAYPIFEYLVSNVSYPPERLADAHELIGCKLLDECNDIPRALNYWRAALTIRNMSSPPVEKLPVMPPQEGFEFAEEFKTEEDLERISFSLDELWTQSLLVCERILGLDHKYFLYRLLYRGATYADELRYQKCIGLWKRDLEIRVHKDSILLNDTWCMAETLVDLFVELKYSSIENPRNVIFQNVLRFKDIVETFNLLVDQLPASQQLLQIHPVHKEQQENFDRILKCITHLIYLLVETSETKKEKKQVKSLIKNLIRINPRSSFHRDSILHLCVSRLNSVTTMLRGKNQLVFPNLKVIQLLLDCGARINDTNNFHSTPLHVAANAYYFCGAMVELLLDNGAHLDIPNHKGETPKSFLLQTQTELCYVKYVSLKCLAATAVINYKIPYKGHVPATLETFLKLHTY